MVPIVDQIRENRLKYLVLVHDLRRAGTEP